MEQKMIIYQVFTRLFGNKGLRNKMNGTLETLRHTAFSL